jgi:hypothetical protein
MKALLIIALLTGLSASCQKVPGPASPALSIGQPFSLASQQRTALPASSGGPVQLTLTEILDSRCPSGKQCIWEGYVAVTVELRDGGSTPQTARIGLSRIPIPPYTRDSVAVTLNQRAYWLRLLAVSDAPASADKMATLRLRPQ